MAIDKTNIKEYNEFTPYIRLVFSTRSKTVEMDNYMQSKVLECLICKSDISKLVNGLREN